VRAVVRAPDGGGQSGWHRPFVTHFTGCNPCGGKLNAIYTREICDDGMRRALGFADDQVLRAYGFRPAVPLNEYAIYTREICDDRVHHVPASVGRVMDTWLFYTVRACARCRSTTPPRALATIDSERRDAWSCGFLREV